MIFAWLTMVLLSFGTANLPLQPQTEQGPVSEADLGDGHYELTLMVLDDTRGTGVASVEVMMKLRRGVILLGRQKKDLMFVTDRQGRVALKGLPKGKLDLLIRLDQNNELRYEADLQPGLKKSVQLRSSRFRVIIEWQLV